MLARRSIEKRGWVMESSTRVARVETFAMGSVGSTERMASRAPPDDGAGVGSRAEGDLHREHIGIGLLRVDDVEFWAGGFAHGEMLYVCGDADDGKSGKLAGGT